MSSGRDDELKALREISKAVSIQNDKLEAQHEQSRLEQRVRATERAHFLVSLGVLSGLLTYYFRNQGFGFRECLTGASGPMCALLTVSMVSVVIYIPGKLLVSTFLPVANRDSLKRVNDIVLPAVHVFMILSIAPLMLLYLLFPGFEYPFFTGKYMLIAILASVAPACWYVGRYQTIMQDIRVSSTQRNIIATSSISDSDRDGTIRITNPNSQPIPGDEIEFRVDAPDTVLQMDIGKTTGEELEDDVLNLSEELGSNSVMSLPVTLNLAPGNPTGEIHVQIDIPGQAPQVETLRYGVDEGHSGTTNIG